MIRRLKTLDKLEPIMPNDHASNACFVNLTKNEATPQNISSNAVKELKSLEPSFGANNKCFGTFKRKWLGSALEIVLSFLLSYYERLGENEVHSLLNGNLKMLGCSSIESRQNGLIFQVLFVEAKDP